VYYNTLFADTSIILPQTFQYDILIAITPTRFPQKHIRNRHYGIATRARGSRFLDGATDPMPKTILTIAYYHIPFATTSIVMIDEKKVIVSRQLSHPDIAAAQRAGHNKNRSAALRR
jgi:hypothetical protein